MVEILLTDDDLTLCHHAAVHREKVRARIRGHKPNNIHNSTTDLYQACFLGVQGEMAVARYLALEDDWDRVLRVNLKGAFFAIRHALPLMRDGGSIVVTGSIGSVAAVPGNVA